MRLLLFLLIVECNFNFNGMEFFKMKKMFLLIIVVAVVIFTIIGFQVYSSIYNMGNASEKNIKALHKQSESTLSNYATTIAEIAQVPNKYKKDLIEVIKTTMQSRYGENGAGGNNKDLIAQFVTENNLQLDSSVYLNMQNAMISGRKEFRISQEKVVDACRDYEQELGTFVTGKILRFAGYPKIDLKPYCEVVSDAQTQEVMKTKIQQPVKID